MEPEVEDIILGGLSTWRKNLVLGVPYLLNAFTCVLLIALFILFVVFIANPFSSIDRSDFSSMIKSVNWLFVFIDVLLCLFGVVLLFLVSSFFLSGAIGMSMTALKTGRTTIGDMFSYGSRYYFRVFLANLMIMVVTMAVAVSALMIQFILRGEYVQIASVFLGILFAPVPYAIVISNLGPFEGLKRGTGFVSKNKFETVMVYVFITTFTSIIGLICLAVLGLIAALVLALMPITDFSYQSLIDAVTASIPVMVLGAVFSVIMLFLVMALITEPIVALSWSNYYLAREKNV